mmetsp:Transcript_20353/g.27522  ORF Transcript_20353/g.27522 Transcript_20353/m.27522 type:complete len:510 (-) Transcript_20353:838-2367(-)
MDQVLGAGVEVDIGLDGGSVGVEGIIRKFAIQAPAEVKKGVEHSELYERPNGLRGHRAHDGGANSAVPGDGEVRLGTDGEDHGEGAVAAIEIFETRVVKNDQHGSVNELTNEDSDHSVVRLEGHRLEAQRFDELNEEHLQGEVDADDKEGDAHGDEANGGAIAGNFRASLYLGAIATLPFLLGSPSTGFFVLHGAEAGEDRGDLATDVLAAVLVVVEPLVSSELHQRVSRVHFPHLVAVDRVVVLADQLVSHGLGLDGCEESDEKDDEDGQDDVNQVGVADLLVEVAVLPDDVGGLRGFSHLALVASDDDAVLVDHVIVALFALEGDEGALGHDEPGELGAAVLALAMNLLRQLTVDFVHLRPLLVLNEGSTVAKVVDEPRVVVGEVDISDAVAFLATELLELVFEDLLQPELELEAWVLVVFEAVLVNIVLHLLNLLARQLHLEGVVGRSHSLQIELFLLDCDRALTVGDDGKEGEGGEDFDAAGKQSLLSLLFQLFICHLAAVLDEE